MTIDLMVVDLLSVEEPGVSLLPYHFGADDREDYSLGPPLFSRITNADLPPLYAVEQFLDCFRAVQKIPLPPVFGQGESRKGLVPRAVDGSLDHLIAGVGP